MNKDILKIVNKNTVFRDTVKNKNKIRQHGAKTGSSQSEGQKNNYKK